MFQTVHYYLKSEKIKTPVTIVMLADLHNHIYGEGNDILLEAIDENSPDFVCLAGDMLIGNSKIPFEAGQKAVLELAKKYPVFYGLGNHEARMKEDREIYGTLYEEYMEPVKRAGVKVLDNTFESCQCGENRFKIYGYTMPMEYFKKFKNHKLEVKAMEETLGKSAGDSYEILLAHNPVYFKEYAAWGADLTLSGHLHGGIIRLPLLGGVISPQARLFPRYCAGKYEINKKYLIVSRGLGTHTIPFRFNNKPELSVIHLESV